MNDKEKLNMTTSNCPVCRRTGEIVLDFPHEFHGCQFALHKCKSCDLSYTFPQPTDDLLENIYAGEYWTREKTVRKQGVMASMVHRFNTIRLTAMIKPLLRRLPQGSSILEVGCGSGQLAVYLKKRGYHIEVTDISQDILDEIRDVHSIKGYCGKLEDIRFSKAYDSIIFNNVLEHVSNPVSALQKAEQILANEGFIFIEVPNIAGLQFMLFKKSWFPLQIPQHLFHFSPASINKIAIACSLEKVWCSTFSPRISPAGYVASIFPELRPEKIRQSWSKKYLLMYLGLQFLFLPLAYAEAIAGKGSAVRALYKKRCG
ncbi:MAG: class I SAM-dependent methyltransferase [Desulfobacterales bacterium]|nr:class I SAM-dependent methyltransferase [Desulfobacterales bacterium]